MFFKVPEHEKSVRMMPLFKHFTIAYLLGVVGLFVLTLILDSVGFGDSGSLLPAMVGAGYYMGYKYIQINNAVPSKQMRKNLTLRTLSVTFLLQLALFALFSTFDNPISQIFKNDGFWPLVSLELSFNFITHYIFVGLGIRFAVNGHQKDIKKGGVGIVRVANPAANERLEREKSVAMFPLIVRFSWVFVLALICFSLFLVLFIYFGISATSYSTVAIFAFALPAYFMVQKYIYIYGENPSSKMSVKLLMMSYGIIFLFTMLFLTSSALVNAEALNVARTIANDEWSIVIPAMTIGFFLAHVIFSGLGIFCASMEHKGKLARLAVHENDGANTSLWHRIFVYSTRRTPIVLASDFSEREKSLSMAACLIYFTKIFSVSYLGIFGVSYLLTTAGFDAVGTFSILGLCIPGYFLGRRFVNLYGDYPSAKMLQKLTLYSYVVTFFSMILVGLVVAFFTSQMVSSLQAIFDIDLISLIVALFIFGFISHYLCVSLSMKVAIEDIANRPKSHRTRSSFWTINSYGFRIVIFIMLLSIMHSVDVSNPRELLNFTRGKHFYNADYDAQAVKEFNRFIETRQTDANVYRMLGLSYFYLDMLEEAQKSFDKAITLKPNQYQSYYGRGLVLIELEQFHEAITDYTTVIALEPSYSRGYFKRGIAKSELQKHEEAIADYDMAISLWPDNEYAYFNRGNAYTNLKQYEFAIRDYDEAIQLNSEYAHAYYRRGHAKFKSQDFEEAIIDLDKAISLRPKLGEAYRDRSASYRRLGNLEKAKADCDQANALIAYPHHCF